MGESLVENDPQYSEGSRTILYLIIFACFFFFFEPPCIGDPVNTGDIIGYLHPFYKYLRIIPLLISIFLVTRIGLPSKVFFLVILYNLIIMFSSILNGNIDSNLIVAFVYTFCICSFTEYFVSNGYLPIFCNAVSLFLFLLVFVNFISIILFPEGYVNERGWPYNYFLGYKNDHIVVFLPALFFSGVKGFLEPNSSRKTLYVVLFVVLISCFLNRSTTALAVTGFLGLLILFAVNRNIPKWLNLRFAFVLGTIISIIFISLVLGDLLSDFTSAASEMTEKEGDTIESRALIWIDALQLFWNSPFLGNGVVTFLTDSFYEYGQAHNQYLDVVVVGGLFLLLVFFVIISILSQRLRILDNRKLANLVFFVFCAYFMEFILEGRRNNYLFYVIMIFTYHLPTYFDMSKCQGEE